MDQSALDDRKPGSQLYGTQPVYLRRENSGKYHVGFMRNSYGMQFEYNENSNYLFKMIGGIVEMKFFLGDTPE